MLLKNGIFYFNFYGSSILLYLLYNSILLKLLSIKNSYICYIMKAVFLYPLEVIMNRHKGASYCGLTSVYAMKMLIALAAEAKDA